MLLVANWASYFLLQVTWQAVFQRAGKGWVRGTEAMALDCAVPAGSGLQPLVNSPRGMTPSKALALTLVLDAASGKSWALSLQPERERLAAAWARSPQ